MQLDFNYQDFDYVTVQNTVKLDWSRVWSNRGHTLGEGMISPDHKYFYVNIPKNYSTFIKSVLGDLGWVYASIEDHKHARPIVVLRDPIERWISGIHEYLLMYHVNTLDQVCEPYNMGYSPLSGEKLGISLLFDRITFDDHTERQAVFLKDISNLDQCVWLECNKNFNQSFGQLLSDLGYPNNVINRQAENSSRESSTLGNKRRLFKDFMQQLIASDQFKMYNLQQWYWCDYQLINQAKFYGTR